MTALNKKALRESAIHAQSNDDWGCDGDNFHDQATPDVVLALLHELEAAEKRIAELEARDINIKRQAQALFEAIANPNDCYIPAYVRCLREALNGNSTGIGVKGE
ncbi:hypothetical protein DLO04_14210 [Salmonella enterica]|nr:hypothetical protein [Salmonella enterica]